MVAASLRRRAASAALALFCMCFLSTCDFLTADIFPSWLSYAAARFDMESAAADFVTASNQLNGIDVEYIRTLSGKDLVVILFMGSGNRRLLLLDPGDMKLLTALDDSVDFTPFLGAGSNGELACGRRSIDPVTFATAAGANIGVDGSRQWLVRIGPGMDQFLIGYNESMLEVQRQKYDVLWSIIGASQTGTTWAAPYPTTSWILLDCETGGTGVAADFLFLNYGGTTQYGYASHFAAASSIDTGTLNFLGSADSVTGPFRLDDGRAWITSGGPVAFVRGDRSSDRLVRYRNGTGSVSPWSESTVADSIPVDDNDELTVLSFEPSGEWWFAYDRRTGYLYKLRTWWK